MKIKKLSTLMSLAFIALAAFHPITATAPELDPQEQQDLIREVNTALDTYFQAQLKILRTIASRIEELLQQVESHVLKPQNKREFVENAKSMRQFMHSFESTAFVTIDPGTVHLLSYFNSEMIKHFIGVLDNQVREFPAFSVQNLYKRYAPIELTLEILENGVATNTKLLDQLTTKTTSAGLTWKNKLYRKFNAKVIQPAVKYNRAEAAFDLGLLCSYVYVAHNVLPARFRNYVGSFFGKPPLPKVDSTGKTLDNDALAFVGGRATTIDNASPVGRFDVFLGTVIGVSVFPIGGKLVNRFMGSSSESRRQFRQKMYDYVVHKHNNAMGGVYAIKQPEQSQNIIIPRITFKDIVGLDHAKAELQRIPDFLENPERYKSGKGDPEKGYLLTGPTRTGKSYIVEGLVGEIRAMYVRNGKNPDDFKYFVVPAQLINSTGIKDLIAEAKTMAPCLLFIDEIDLLGLQRAGGSKQVLSEFLEGMSGCMEADADKTVIIIGATNRPENLDEALRQPGRFGKEIRFEYPLFDARKQYFVKKLGAITDLSMFDIDKLTYETEGCSFEALNTMIKGALYSGIVNNEPLSQELLEMSLDRDIRNIIIAPLPLDKHERELIAAHLAGHALAMLLLNSKTTLAKITMRAYLTQLKEVSVWETTVAKDTNKDQREKKIKYGKLFTYHKIETRNYDNKEEKIKQCKIELAGFAAEALLLGEDSSGYSYHKEDTQEAFEIAKSIVTKGLQMDQFTDDIKSKFMDKALALTEQCEQEILMLLGQNKDKLRSIADALLENIDLTGEEVAQLAGFAPVPTKQKSASAQMVRQEFGFQELQEEPIAV